MMLGLSEMFGAFKERRLGPCPFVALEGAVEITEKFERCGWVLGKFDVTTDFDGDIVGVTVGQVEGEELLGAALGLDGGKVLGTALGPDDGGQLGIILELDEGNVLGDKVGCVG